ncbi:IQ calmodulin-binding motif-containing protein 1 [Nymphon striatum]|nr:IQ calmodulin-binding motif-containing protein 1 [Nymphon striatum]
MPSTPKEISKLASEIVASDINDLPKLMLSLGEITYNASKDEKLLNKVCAEILSYKLFPLLIGILKQDFTKYEEKWVFAAKLCQTLQSVSTCMASSSIDLGEYLSILPKCVNNVLLLAHNIQQSYKVCERKNDKLLMLKNFNQVLNSLLLILQVHENLLGSIICCSWLHEMLMNSSDDSKETFVPLVSFLCQTCQTSNDVKSMKKKSVEVILDELVYRLSTSEDKSITKCHLARKNDEKRKKQLSLELKQNEAINRKQEMRKSKQRQLEMLTMIPASQVENYFQNEQNIAATKMQAIWRGYKSRKQYPQIRYDVLRHRAAVIIQTQVRIWLEKRDATQRKIIKNTHLSEEQSESYQKIIDEWRINNIVKVGTREEQENLFEKSQKLLQEFYSTLPYVQHSLEHCKILSAEVDIISDLIGRSSMDHFRDEEIRLFKSSSPKIVADAKSRHLEALKNTREPAWKRN